MIENQTIGSNFSFPFNQMKVYITRKKKKG